MAERGRRTFGPVVLLGLAGAVLTAVAGGRDWATASGRAAGAPVTVAAKGSESAPLVLALGLVALAAWGVVLVVRTRGRRVVGVVGAFASAGALVSAAVSAGRARDDAVRALVARGASGGAASLTGWYVVALVGAVVALAAFVLTVRLAPAWPTMSARYDAPSARGNGAPAPDPSAAGEAAERELWKALDEGHDPTA